MSPSIEVSVQRPVAEAAHREVTLAQRLRSLALPLLLATGGCVLVAALIQHVGVAALYALLGAAAPWLPLALALEAARIVCEAQAARSLYRGVAGIGGTVPRWSALLRVHLLSYGVIAFAPAGRASGEALRATLLARSVGGARAAAVGTVSQALALVAAGLVSLPCAVAARLAGADTLAISLLLQAIALSVLGALVLVAARRREVGSLLRRFRKVADAGDVYVQAMHALPPVPLAALALTLAGRGAQLLLLTTLLVAVGAHIDLRGAFVALGALLVGTSAGDLIPGQLGATDGALALFHNAMRATEAQAVGAALLVHVVQLAWTLAATVGSALQHSAAGAARASATRRSATV